MKKIFSKTAFSLLELIIASVLVVVVVLGIFAINSVLSNNNQDYGQRYSIKSATQITLNHILNNASEAIGSGTNINGALDQGILSYFFSSPYNIPGNSYTLCIHQDIPPVPYGNYTVDNIPPTSTPATPPDYTNSRWLCYTWYNPNFPCPSTWAACSSYQIWYCTMPYNSSPPDWGTHVCVPGMSGETTPQFLGTAYSFKPSFTSTSGFSITIQNCLNDSEPAPRACNGGGDGISGDPVNNPEVTVSGTVFPSQEGIQQN